MSKYYDIPQDLNSIPWQNFILTKRRKRMTNYEYIMVRMTPQQLANLYAQTNSCSKCPRRKEYKNCFMRGNYDKKCSELLTDWLCQPHHTNGLLDQ